MADSITGFNTVIDWILAVIAGVELWQFFLRTLHRENLSVWSQFKKINSTVRSRRIWQTLTLCGPLILSGAASIVKTYVSNFPRCDGNGGIFPEVLTIFD